jgi:hypothetical protein
VAVLLGVPGYLFADAPAAGGLQHLEGDNMRQTRLRRLLEALDHNARMRLLLRALWTADPEYVRRLLSR